MIKSQNLAMKKSPPFPIGIAYGARRGSFFESVSDLGEVKKV